MPLDFAGLVRRRLAETRQSKHRAAVDGGLPQDAIRSVLNGHSPRLERLEEICDALDLELYVGPPRDTERSDFDAGEIPIRADKQTRAASLTRFNPDVQLPVRTWKAFSPEGFLTKPDESERAPARKVSTTRRPSTPARSPTRWCQPASGPETIVWFPRVHNSERSGSSGSDSKTAARRSDC